MSITDGGIALESSELENPAARPALIYPFDGPPPRGQPMEVAPGVHWLRMPLPFALNHINLWGLDDGDGWAVVDTGFSTQEVVAEWRALFAAAPDRRPMTRIFVTHMHPDHIGLAGWLARKFKVPLWMTRLEYLTCRMLVSDTGREAPPEAVDFYRQAGWSEEALETYRIRFGSFGKHIHALPDAFQRLSDGQQLRIGAHDWRIIVGSGHSPEHACMYCPDLKVLISGDQVLPKISSNISVYPNEPAADPMADWLASLDKLQREVPDDVLVLPAHGECFRGLHARIDSLRRGHARGFERLQRSLREPRRAVDVFPSLFARQIAQTDMHLLSMATGESLACLNHLIGLGQAERWVDASGVAWYQSTANDGAQISGL